MKNRLSFTLVGAILISLLNSCGNELITKDLMGGGIFKFHVEGVNTRTSTDNLNDGFIQVGNFVGIFGVTTDGYIVNGTNNKYRAESDGNLKAESGDISISNNVSTVDFYAYAPYNSEWTAYDKEYDFSVATDQSNDSGYLASDLLSSIGTKYSKGNEGDIGLRFDHKLAKINLVIQKEASALLGASVTLNGTKIQTTFNPSTGAIGNDTGEVHDIKMLSSLGDKAEVGAYCIIVPQTLEAKENLFTIEDRDKNYTVSLDKSIEIAGGNSYTFTITIKDDDAVLKVGKPNVNPWVDGDEDNNGNEGDGNEGEVDEEKTETIELEIGSFSPHQPSDLLSNSNLDWTKGGDGTLKWNSRCTSEYYVIILPYIPAFGNPILMEKHSKFRKLILEIENFKLDEDAKPEETYIVVAGKTNDGVNIFVDSYSKEVKINGNGKYIIDFTQPVNHNFLESATEVIISATCSNPYNDSAFNSAKFTKAELVMAIE